MIRPADYTPPAVNAAALEGDEVSPGDARYGLIWINPGRMSGEPCFFGTRLPVAVLVDHLARGSDVDTFARDYDLDPAHARAVLAWLAQQSDRDAA